MSSEALVMSQVRLAAPTLGAHLFRNNVGALLDQQGRPVRFGLANDSPQMNRAIKSADLIGWRSVIVTPEMVGERVAIVLSVECKAPGWTFHPNDPRDRAQAAWAGLVREAGGVAIWATRADDLRAALAPDAGRG